MTGHPGFALALRDVVSSVVQQRALEAGVQLRPVEHESIGGALPARVHLFDAVESICDDHHSAARVQRCTTSVIRLPRQLAEPSGLRQRKKAQSRIQKNDQVTQTSKETLSNTFKYQFKTNSR